MFTILSLSFWVSYMDACILAAPKSSSQQRRTHNSFLTICFVFMFSLKSTSNMLSSQTSSVRERGGQGEWEVKATKFHINCVVCEGWPASRFWPQFEFSYIRCDSETTLCWTVKGVNLLPFFSLPDMPSKTLSLCPNRPHCDSPRHVFASNYQKTGFYLLFRKESSHKSEEEEVRRSPKSQHRLVIVCPSLQHHRH